MAKGVVERINTQSFDEAISAMDKAVKAFKSARSKIIKTTDPVTNDWKGDGADKFKKVYKKLKIELKDEEINLETIRDDLKSIKESYEGWDSDLATHFKGDGV